MGSQLHAVEGLVRAMYDKIVEKPSHEKSICSGEAKIMRVLAADINRLEAERIKQEVVLSEKEKLLAKFKQKHELSTKQTGQMTDFSINPTKSESSRKSSKKIQSKKRDIAMVKQLVSKPNPLQHLPTRPRKKQQSSHRIDNRANRHARFVQSLPLNFDAEPRDATIISMDENQLKRKLERSKRRVEMEARNREIAKKYKSATRNRGVVETHQMHSKDRKAKLEESYLRRRLEDRENRPVGTGKTTYDWERVPGSDWSRFS